MSDSKIRQVDPSGRIDSATTFRADEDSSAHALHRRCDHALGLGR